MAEYIEREAVVTALNKAYDHMNALSPHFYSGYQNAAHRIRDFPAADVVPVRHGRWEQRRDCVYCSNCGKGYKIRVGVLTAKMYRYCPNCGADMRGAEND